MALPPLLVLPDARAYRAYYESHYCKTPVITFDGITVRFFPERFDHAFYRDSSPTAQDKANFDLQRSQRMNWIGAVLTDPTAEVYRRVMGIGRVRRIALVPSERYAVITKINSRNPSRASFMTAYIVDSNNALANTRSNPPW